MGDFEPKKMWEPPIGEAFFVTFTVNRRNFQLKVECIYRDHATERYKATYGMYTFQLQCNWPVFRNRGLKHRMPDWKLIEGKLTYRSSFQQIILAIENYITKHHA